MRKITLVFILLLLGNYAWTQEEATQTTTQDSSRTSSLTEEETRKYEVSNECE
jgi:hypothetical protein